MWKRKKWNTRITINPTLNMDLFQICVIYLFHWLEWGCRKSKWISGACKLKWCVSCFNFICFVMCVCVCVCVCVSLCTMHIVIFSVFCLCTYLYWFVVILLFCVIFIFFCRTTATGWKPSCSNNNNDDNNNNNNNNNNNSTLRDLQSNAIEQLYETITDAWWPTTANLKCKAENLSKTSSVIHKFTQ